MSWPWSSPFFRWWKLVPLTYRLFISDTPKSCHPAGRGKVSPGSPGHKFSPTKKFPAGAKQIICQVLVSLSKWVVPLFLAWVWWNTQFHPFGKVPLCHSDRQIHQNSQTLSWWDSWGRKGHARGKGRFYGPCLFPCPFGQGWGQTAFHLSRTLLIHKTRIAITFQRDWENIHKSKGIFMEMLIKCHDWKAE